MPELIQNIDAIARRKRRGVLFVLFHDKDDFEAFTDYESLATRQELIAWLDANAIGWQPCGEIARETGFGPYQGEIYIDVPFDENDPAYRKLRDYLENPDRTPKIPGVRFCYLSLDSAMKNAHHDEPGFWER